LTSADLVLEVIVCSVADAIEAEQGGAKRLEIIRDFARGGMTPELEFVREVMKAVSVPVRVMLRESEAYSVTDEREIEQLCARAREFAALEVDGLVLGFIREGQIDVKLSQRILSCAPGLKATFHHAFEETNEAGAAIEKLKTLGQVDRVLTAGGPGDWSKKIERLASYQRTANPGIKVLAGGGLDIQVLKEIRANTSINEFHVGRAARFQSQIEGPVHSELVRELVKAIEK
jgi:copper homeostasis protein